jgi:hypothetical protein
MLDMTATVDSFGNLSVKMPSDDDKEAEIIKQCTSLLEQAEILHNIGNEKSAAEAFAKALSIDPLRKTLKSSDYLKHLKGLADLKKFDEIVIFMTGKLDQGLDLALNIDPFNTLALLGKGLLFAFKENSTKH